MHTPYDIKDGTIEKWLQSDNWCLRITAERLREGPVPLSIIESGLLSTSNDIRTAAAEACLGRTDISVKLIKSWFKSESGTHRLAAMKAAADHPGVPLSIIKQGLSDHNNFIRKAAARACRGRSDILVPTIAEWCHSDDWHLRLAAMEACSSRDDVPFCLIEDGLEDSPSVRAAAKRAAAHRGQIFRAFEPREEVYERCLGGVIVAAKIPSDAHIVGNFGKECRASKALITDVIGHLDHERVGISLHDRCTVYCLGNEIEYPNFDFSEAKDAEGFHFFNTLSEAQRA